MQSYDYNQLSIEERYQVLSRPKISQSPLLKEGVKDIMAKVRMERDQGLRDLSLAIDDVKLLSFAVSQQEIDQAMESIDPRSISAMKQAIRNITRFHEAQRPSTITVETSPGVVCRMESRPIERVGLYVPGGSAPLVSTVMMLGVPASLARCPVKVLCTPPRKDGSINPAILVAAKLTGIDQIYKLGGAQAIAAMSYGTKTIPKVDKIFGPGNAWVTEAKLQASTEIGGPSIDLPAGPSELLVVADGEAKAAFVAADLLSQAEHDASSQTILVSPSIKLITAVQKELKRQIQNLDRREIAQKAIDNSRAILCENIDQALEISNLYGPEHLILQVDQPDQYSPQIYNAASVFLGPWAPESVGDYASGTNHVLPTYGYSRSISGLGMEAFMKKISFQSLSYGGLKDLASSVTHLCDLEGLGAHRHAVDIRLNEYGDPS